MARHPAAAGGLDSLPQGARIGTGSLRRQAQLLHHRPDLRTLEIRGNVETRLRKLDEGEYDAIVLAVAGLTRLELGDRISFELRPPLLYPAVGQGALGVECRIDDGELRRVLESITDRRAHAAATAERTVLAEMRAICAAIPAPTLANMVEGGRTPILPQAELAEIGYKIAIYPNALTRIMARAGQRLVRHHLRPMHLALAGPITRRARHRFFRDLGEDAPDLLLLALADAAGLRGDDPLVVWVGEGGRVLRELMAGAAEERALAAAPPLVTGEDVMAAFALAPGPEVGRLLARAREAQALGLVATREEALSLLARDGPLLDTPEAPS